MKIKALIFLFIIPCSIFSYTQDQIDRLNTLISTGKQSLLVNDMSSGKKINKHIPGEGVFISLGMPEDSIIQSLKSADEYNIPVYIRGLIDNDFKKTVLFIKDIIQKNDLSGVSIDPVLFKEFKIKAVPAIVLSSKNSDCFEAETCSASDFDVVYGVTAETGLKIIRDKGAVAKDIAETCLKENSCV